MFISSRSAAMTPAYARAATPRSISGSRADPSRPRRWPNSALALGRDLGHSVSLAHACWLCGITRYLLDDVEGCSALASQATQLGEEYGYVAARTLGRLVGGWVATRRGRVAEGIAEIEKVLAAQGASARRIVYKAYLIAILAEAKASIGAFDVALALTDEAIAEGEETGMRLYVPEIHRLRGSYLLARSRAAEAEAEASFLSAIEMARTQGALMLELRATTSLAQLWAGQGRREEAHARLWAVDGRFDEGVASADLVAARQLLQELA